MLKKIKGYIALTRWIEIYDYTLATTLIAAFYANAQLDWRIVFIYLNNFINQLFVYALNDAEDAEDDSKEPKKAKRNPVSNGTLTKKEAYIFSGILAALALISSMSLSYYFQSPSLSWISLSALIVMFLYNWIPVRLKSMRILDIVSHAYTLGGVTFLFTFLAYNPELTWVGILGAFCIHAISAFGQLENQIRDFEVDQLCKIKNTTDLIGTKVAKILQYTLLITGIASIFVYIFSLPDYLTLLVWVAITYSIAVFLPLLRFTFTKDTKILKQNMMRLALLGSYVLLILRLLKII